MPEQSITKILSKYVDVYSNVKYLNEAYDVG